MSEGANREVHPAVFVLDERGHPLDLCHPARARRLPAVGRAVVVRHPPFVIRLKDRSVADSTVAGVQVGIDPGSKHTGLAIFTDRDGSRTGRYAIQFDHRGAAIRDKPASRAAYRRGRRSRNLRYRASRFSNRTKPKGWLAPSLRHRIETTMSQVARLTRWVPVIAVHVEKVSFDTHALSAGKPLEGVEYRQGTLAGYEVREYLLAKWGRTAAVNATRWALWRALEATGLPVATASGGRTKWNRSRTGAAKSHTLDALHVGDLDTVTTWPSTVLVAKATGRGSYARTRTDRYGFPRLRLPRTKQVKGFATGDLVRATVPTGKKAGVHTGRVAVRSTGSFNITTRHGTVQGVGHRHARLLQRADGHGYTTHPEARHGAASPPPPEGGGIHTGGT
ncbi:RNA-guided endonuclease IscB [Streptosporangium sp. NPDC049644]|uniref:RNA-guided endonuclease IscB n=1 Tax=Streptosporangium sp. NPDC049644 TaxID=3155507 RepID=UPI0034464230